MCMTSAHRDILRSPLAAVGIRLEDRMIANCNYDRYFSAI